MKLLITIFVVAILMIGCAGSPFQLAKMDRVQLSSVPDDQLIRALRNKVYRTDLMFEEAKSRGLFTDDEIRLIKEKKIRIGMSEEALIASWGRPRKINRSVGSYGVHKQYVYGSYSKYSSPAYVYVDNGKVSSWQD